jgi:hypothetical protein
MSLLPPFIMYDVSLIISAGIPPPPVSLPKYDVSLYISAAYAPLPTWPIYDTSDCAKLPLFTLTAKLPLLDAPSLNTFLLSSSPPPFYIKLPSESLWLA